MGRCTRQLLHAAREKRLQLYTSTTLLLELTDILGRAKFARKLAAAQLSVDQFIEGYVLLATVVHPAAIAPTVLDDPVLACALGAKAELIATGDRHLLDLKEYQGIRVVTAAEALRVVTEIGR